VERPVPCSRIHGSGVLRAMRVPGSNVLTTKVMPSVYRQSASLALRCERTMVCRAGGAARYLCATTGTGMAGQ
jgi:hypothetical protein